jgi:hypothetical protein
VVASVRETVDGILGRTMRYEDGLDALTVAPSADVDRVLAQLVRDAAAALFRAGWQPAELHRVVARRGEPVQGLLVIDAVAGYLRGFARKNVDPRWLAQAVELEARPWWTGDDTYLSEAAGRWRVDRVALLDAVLGLIGVLHRLPPIEVLVPPPGSVAPAAETHRIDGRLLERVRALLAKAESTDFPAEAEAYAAKAQELIARHSLEEAIAGAATPEVVPFARRVGVDHPYEDEKAHLLDAVARANHCETVWSPELGFTTVFGFDADIDAVELLYTSLLVQANRAMARDEPAGGKAGRARLKTFRRSFLIAYAVRVGERLDAATASALRQVGDPADLLPVLASREAQVRETVQRTFPHTVRVRGSRVDSPEGWESGRAAADQAALPTH